MGMTCFITAMWPAYALTCWPSDWLFSLVNLEASQGCSCRINSPIVALLGAAFHLQCHLMGTPIIPYGIRSVYKMLTYTPLLHPLIPTGSSTSKHSKHPKTSQLPLLYKRPPEAFGDALARLGLSEVMANEIITNGITNLNKLRCLTAYALDMLIK
jgi:hypothetical protein